MLKKQVNLLEVNITSDRVHLVPLTLEHAEAIFQEFTEEITSLMNPVPAKHIQETKNFITETRKNMGEGKELVCAVLKRDTREFLGCAGLHELDTATPELGVWIKKSAHGHHYGRESVHALIDWAEANVEYSHLRYPVAAANTASRKIPEFLGGKVVHEYMKTTQGGKTLPYVEYTITKSK